MKRVLVPFVILVALVFVIPSLGCRNESTGNNCIFDWFSESNDQKNREFEQEHGGINSEGVPFQGSEESDEDFNARLELIRGTQEGQNSQITTWILIGGGVLVLLVLMAMLGSRSRVPRNQGYSPPNMSGMDVF